MAIGEVRQLGQLRDALRNLPHLATCIRDFIFSWGLEDSVSRDDKTYPGKPIDLAFADRGAMWKRKRKACRSRVYKYRLSAETWFEHQGVRYTQPGSAQWPSVGGSGPDGLGDDLRIKCPRDFEDCLTEIVTQLKSLKKFKWCCDSLPPPLPVFEALKQARGLRELDVLLRYSREFQHREYPSRCDIRGAAQFTILPQCLSGSSP